MKERMKENRKVGAEVLLNRGNYRLYKEDDLKEEEKDKLFFWILSRIFWELDLKPSLDSYVCLEILGRRDRGITMLSHGNVSTYYCTVFKGEEFLSVIDEVLAEFNTLYGYKAHNFSDETVIKFYVWMGVF